LKRLQIYIEEELDEALAIRAADEKTSKAALIRRFVAERLGGDRSPDPLDELVGARDEEPGRVDDVVYGP
jgi:ribbon-helix-helix CopG family protein